MTIEVPTLLAQVEIDAPTATVWALIIFGILWSIRRRRRR